MTPNPSTRPFVLGVLLFVCLLVGWPAPSQTAGTAAAGKSHCAILVHNRTPYRVLVHVDGVYYGWVNMRQSFTFKGIATARPVVYGTTPYAEYFWGPKVLKCQDQASWELAF
jgi:hypothetical protein